MISSPCCMVFSCKKDEEHLARRESIPRPGDWPVGHHGLSNLHRQMTDDICFQRCVDVPHGRVLPFRLQEYCCRDPKAILTSDRIIHQRDDANGQR
ncbi:hypothetical protein L7G72_02800 [Xenorhabdus bovienii]|uniref:hypothetical protein n=1 Tax=Xenorhabdus bovienii TaxID=40576 RepID=UPI001EDE34CA|nr:hypothetical protein [Xenorhabdus bovienii]MCG3460800.1 hypothetical protein [Xenorhabdus bovienii]